MLLMKRLIRSRLVMRSLFRMMRRWIKMMFSRMISMSKLSKMVIMMRRLNRKSLIMVRLMKMRIL